MGGGSENPSHTISSSSDAKLASDHNLESVVPQKAGSTVGPSIVREKAPILLIVGTNLKARGWLRRFCQRTFPTKLQVLL